MTLLRVRPTNQRTVNEHRIASDYLSVYRLDELHTAWPHRPVAGASRKQSLPCGVWTRDTLQTRLVPSHATSRFSLVLRAITSHDPDHPNPDARPDPTRPPPSSTECAEYGREPLPCGARDLLS